MKKTFRKLLTLILTVLMLLPFAATPSTAATEAPEIADVELVMPDEAFSLKTIGEEIAWTDEFLYMLFGDETEGMSQEELEAFIDENLGITLEQLYSATPDCDYKVTLTNGEVLESDGRIIEYDKYDIYVYALITKEAYLEAVEKGADTIDVKIYGEVSRYLSFSDKEIIYSTYEDVAQADVVECYVKSIEVVSGVPAVVSDYADYIPLDGAEFKVTYPDGTSEILTVEKKLLHEYDYGYYYSYFEYYLGDEELIANVFYGNPDDEEVDYDVEYGYIEFSFKDASCTSYVDYDYEAYFDGVEITDYVLDDDNELVSVTYEITKADGEVLEFTDDFTGMGFVENQLDYTGIHAIDGFYVYAGFSITYAEDYFSDSYEYGVYVAVENSYDEVMFGEFEGEEQSGIIRLIKNIFARLVNFILRLLGR